LYAIVALVTSAILLAAFVPISSFDPLPQINTPAILVSPTSDIQKAVVVLPEAGPEDLTFDSEGNLFTGLGNGTIIKIKSNGTISHYGHGGRPLSLKFDKNGNLVVCDALIGLLSVDKTGKVAILSNTVTHSGITSKINFADYHIFGSDGKVYFSDASSKYGIHAWIYDFLEGRPHGSLFVYDPASGKTKYLIKEELYFANGVAISTSEDYILVCESFKFRIIQYWLKGPKAGSFEVFIDGLPGTPDNMFMTPRGTLLVALPTLRKPESELMFQFPAVSRLLYRVPQSFHPQPTGTAIIEFDLQTKNVVRYFSDPTNKKFATITSAVEHDGHLYFACLTGGLHKLKL